MPDTSVRGQSPDAPELAEILKQLGSHRRKAWDQTYGKEHWTHEESDAYWGHPVLLACRWLEEHSGIKREDLEAAAFRLTTPLGLRGMADLPGPNGKVDKGMPDWLWMIPKFREMDRDGTTAKLWEKLLDECPAVLVEAGLVPAAGPTLPDKEVGGAARTAEKRPRTNALMMDILTRIPESHGWSIRQFQKETGRSVASIQGTEAWKKLEETRAEGKATKALSRAKLNRPGRRRAK